MNKKMYSFDRKPRDRGQSTLEFALMAPFLLLLLTGVVEIGRATFYTVEVNNAATAGVQFAAQNTITAANTALIQRTAQSDANVAGMSVLPSYGCTCDEGAGTSCTYPIPSQGACMNACPAGSQRVECAQVLTQATITPLFHFPGLPTSYQANGRAVMRVRN
jgi:Flp pilus assembly protein TadG